MRVSGHLVIGAEAAAGASAYRKVKVAAVGAATPCPCLLQLLEPTPYVRLLQHSVSDHGSRPAMMADQNEHTTNGTAVTINGPHPLETFTPEELLKQMEQLIKENNELKEAVKQTNHAMKERYEELATWHEKQKEERDQIQKKCEEAKKRLMALTAENEALKKAQGQSAGSTQGTSTGDLHSEDMDSTLVEQLRAQNHRLQTEKADLVAMNSELLVKLGAATEDSFVEIQIVESMDAEFKQKDLECKGSDSKLVYPSKADDHSEKCLSEELTVRHLLHMLRDKALKLENLELELHLYKERLSELSKVVETSDGATQTEENAAGQFSANIDQESASESGLVDVMKQNPENTASVKELNAPNNQSTNEVEVLKSQVMSLVQDLQEAQKKLNEAEDMKKTLQERCLDLEQKLVNNQMVLEDVKQLKFSNEKLKLQVESLQSEQKIEQIKLADEKLKLAEEKRKFAQMQAAYDNLFEDHKNFMKVNEEMKIKEGKQMETLNTLVADLDIAKETIVQKQKTIDELAETVSLQAVRLTVQNAQSTELVGVSEQLEVAEKALVEKQQKIDAMKQTIIKQEEEMETVAIFKAQAEVYSADFHAERAAREAIHNEKESLMARLNFLEIENTQLKEDLDKLGRQSLVELQRRHGSCGSVVEDDPMLHQRGVREPRNSGWEHQGILPEHTCPKCGIVVPDIDTLQIHVMDCII
ncbi:optineurin isoform X2 [Narcine bancroftii]|uniref:optineurin isoform X2 n=1 Tax=Narcine bancroftii TaxID=1343680 RepID=UPI003831DA2F